MPIALADLDELETALLGVLCIGLPPSKSAGDDSFRVDHVTAVVTALAEGRERGAYLEPGSPAVTPAFRARLRASIESLAARGVVAYAPAGMPAAVGTFEAGLELDLVTPDEQPAVMDRFLAQLCMERLFNVKSVYPFLMDRYARSGEVWRRLREAGYGA